MGGGEFWGGSRFYLGGGVSLTGDDGDPGNEEGGRHHQTPLAQGGVIWPMGRRDGGEWAGR